MPIRNTVLQKSGLNKAQVHYSRKEDKMEYKKFVCLAKQCMNNNEYSECELLRAPITDRSCPFYKTDQENIDECVKLGVLTWKQMQRLARKYEF